MATGNKGSRRKLPPAAKAPAPAAPAAAPAPMTEAEAAPALEAAHTAADIVLPPAVVVEAITVETPAPRSDEQAPNPDGDPASAAAPADPATTASVEAETAEEPIMDATTTTQNVTNDMAQKGEAMFAEANERAKGAMEKGTKFFAELTEFGKGNIEALVESSKIAARGFETMGQDAAAYARSSWEQGSAAMRTLATAKSPTEFMKLQADFAREAFDAAVAQGSRSTEASLKLVGEIAQPISNRVAIAAEKVKVAA